MKRQWLKLIALFLAGIIFTSQLPLNIGIQPVIAQSPNSCANISQPLTPEEENWAKVAWQYFLNNYQPETGFTNSANNYPSGTLWDMGNYLMALNSARWLNLTTQEDFDQRLNKFLDSLGKLRLFEDSLPNKVYNTANGQLVDYGNNPIERGIGWSALDIGRILAAFHVIRICHPQYTDWLQTIVNRWAISRSIKDKMLYGATVLPDGKTMLVQEGRLGYEEYAARGYELWGFAAPVALSFEPFKMVEIYGVKVPVDTRDFQSTNANNYVVSESYILDGIEFGFLGQQMQEYATNVLEVQKRRYQATGQLTAVTEDNIDGSPYFLYNTIFANGVAWATITENNQPYPQLRTISTKAALGWSYIFPQNTYAQQLKTVVNSFISPDGGGFVAGQFEETKKNNGILTGNTNGLILELLYYQAKGNRPLIENAKVTASTGKPKGVTVMKEYPAPPQAEVTNPPSINNPQNTSINIPPISPVRETSFPQCYNLTRNLNIIERRYASSAWKYFETNYEPKTGLVSDRTDMKATNLWGMGNYLSALQTAFSLGIIDSNTFDTRIRQFLGTLKQISLFAGELPHRGYDIRTLTPVDYGMNPTEEGIGWSGLDVGRLLLSLHNIKACYPQYIQPIDNILLDWSYIRVVNNQRLHNAVVEKKDNKSFTRIYPADFLGYEELSARGFQLWGFSVDNSVDQNYQMMEVEGVKVPIARKDKNSNAQEQYTVSSPFLNYGLLLGLDSTMKPILANLFQAQENRYRNSNILNASDTSLIQSDPYVVTSSIVGKTKPWAVLTDNQFSNTKRITSTGVAFAFSALYPDNEYAKLLRQSVADLSNSNLGYSEGFYEESGDRVSGFSNNTNSLILQSLLYSVTQQPLLLNRFDFNSPWWKAIENQKSGNGLPTTSTPQIKFISQGSQNYWTSLNQKSPISSLPNLPNIEKPLPFNSLNNIEKPLLPQNTEKPSSVVTITPSSFTSEDKKSAMMAWKYFERNWHESTGLVNAVEYYTWTTLWDLGSSVLAIHSAYQLKIIPQSNFEMMMSKTLSTLDNLKLSTISNLPNKAYSTTNAQMRTLDNKFDPSGITGWSVLDLARLLVSLRVVYNHYPSYQAQIDRIIQKWQLNRLIKDGRLKGGIIQQGKVKLVQEGRLGYEQYAAQAFKLWGIIAENALNNPPIKPVEIEGIILQVDQRNLANSNASNYLTNDPFLLWGLEIGWQGEVIPPINKLLEVQERRYQRTKILTAVNEDSLDRSPYFLYYSIYANGEKWTAISSTGKSYPQYRTLSTKAAFAWNALKPEHPYPQKLHQAVNNLGDINKGYFAGKYENPSLGINKLLNINTNAIVLESLLYKIKQKPLIIN
ncbi:DUF3131 domain-containing protein [Geminocystis sp. GBBB08]|uniref:DUF3131 domain-containing protein n=1 Tax=Geminocystis sp. GBBB08 TaxID=2604140 RepID=UPI0027E2796B|nr:DUF3131 domain-containing protein [Geminocystis sp. GBBB08]MBL1210867.1 DUF3131 domain-containing protein [Geminocystis sp. GBBB08]